MTFARIRILVSHVSLQFSMQVPRVRRIAELASKDKAARYEWVDVKKTKKRTKITDLAVTRIGVRGWLRAAAKARYCYSLVPQVSEEFC